MPKILVEVCAGTHCTLMGAMDIIDSVEGLLEFHQDINPDFEIEVRPIACSKVCEKGQHAPVVLINGEMFLQTNSESVMEKILELTANPSSTKG